MIVVINLVQASGRIREPDTGAALKLPAITQPRAVVVNQQTQIAIFNR